MGPWESKLEGALKGDPQKAAADASDEWQKYALLLEPVVRALQTEAGLQDAGSHESVGGVSGPALAGQLRKSARDTQDRIKEINKGRQALSEASTAAFRAKQGQKRVHNTVIPDAPSSVPPLGPGQPTKGEIKNRSDAQNKQEARADAEQERERIARETYTGLDTDYEPPTEKMKEIHGIPDPEPSQPGSVGAGGPIGAGASTGHDNGGNGGNGGSSSWPDDGGLNGDGGNGTDDGGIDDGGTDDGGTDDGGTDWPGTDGPGTDGPGGEDPIIVNPQPGDDDGGFAGSPVLGGSSDGGSSLSPGAIGGLAGGVTAGGVGLAAGLRGGLSLPGSLSTSGVRSIGSMSSTGASSTLGRTGAATGGSPTAARGTGTAARGTGGAASGGRGAGGRGAGGRSGSRGRGGVGSGRGGRRSKDDEKHGDRDLFDDGEDWIDDEGASPATLG